MIETLYPALIFLTGGAAVFLHYTRRIEEEDRYRWFVPSVFFFAFFVVTGIILFFLWPAPTQGRGMGAVAVSVTSVLVTLWWWIVFTAIYSVAAVVLLMHFGKKYRHKDGVSSGVTITLALLGVLVLAFLIFL